MNLKLLLQALVICVIVMFMGGSVTLYSQTTGSIGGTVVDANGKTPIIGAIVKIEGSSKGAETDANGEYVILNVDVGDYTVISSLTGYKPSKQSGVKVSVDQRTKINFELVSSEIRTDTVEIVAERKGIDVEISGRQITSDQIKNSGIQGIQNIVGKTAGVIQDERGGALNIRGSRSSENLIIVGGVATKNPNARL